ncbi:hypothetical protein MASR1M8_08530 [Thermomonas brevis]
MSFDPRRRQLLKTLVVAASTLPFASRLGPAFAAGAVPVDEALFPQWLASGDPRPDRVLLWTRVPGAGDVAVRLQVALDAGFERLVVERDVVARADADHCLRVRVAGLQPGTGYHVRFLRETATGWRSSPHGRTRTAPAPDAAVPVRFGTISCQAYEGRWYNTLHALLADPPDFLLHLGDAIYETAADPSAPPAPRQVRLDDAAGAVLLGDGEHRRLAARSLDNYRQLHRTYRSDPLLRRLLAQVPLIATWDDHEYTDDCWQDASTDSEGRADDRDRQRRRNAEQAYFEYTPVDIDIGDTDADGVQAVDPGRLFPRTRLWRELRFGRDLHLFVLDCRSVRSDHLIPEDAFPGALACDAAALAALLPRTGIDPAVAAESLLPYVDATHPLWPKWRKPLQRALNRGYRDAGLDKRAAAAKVQAILAQPIALAVLRRVLARYNDAVPGFLHAPLPPDDDAGLPRGLPWIALGKTGLFGHMGSRYLVVERAYALLAALRAADAEPPGVLGEAQHAWLHEPMAASDARWKVVATSVSMTPMVVDLSDPALDAPPLFRRRFCLNVDQWDGFPLERRRLLQRLDAAGGAVLLSGDIHAGFATQHTARTVEFTVPAVSSETLHAMTAAGARNDPDTAESGQRMVEMLPALLQAAAPEIRYVQTRRHGVGVAETDAHGFGMAMFELPAELVETERYADAAALLAQGRWVRFTCAADDRRLRQADAAPA